MTRFVLRRVGILALQVWGVVSVVFVLIQLLPGDPRYLLVGSNATPEALATLSKHLGLDQPIYVRYVKYMQSVAHGDLGTSAYTSTPVLDELLIRFPATLELVTFAFIVAMLIAIPLGVLSAVAKRARIFRRITFVYGMVAGALPDFWWGLMMIGMFFVYLKVAPPPLGRISVDLSPPHSITKIYTVDALLTGNWSAFKSAFGQLIMPGVTLAFVYAGATLKMTRTQMMEMIDSDFVRYAKATGMPQRRIHAYALRNALLPVVTLGGLTYGYMISGAVLIETIFAWGGVGQYAVQSVTNSDYYAVTGAVMAISIFALLVYMVMDILYAAIDPRIKY